LALEAVPPIVFFSVSVDLNGRDVGQTIDKLKSSISDGIEEAALC
jgi:hypothetical protein